MEPTWWSSTRSSEPHDAQRGRFGGSGTCLFTCRRRRHMTVVPSVSLPPAGHTLTDGPDRRESNGARLEGDSPLREPIPNELRRVSVVLGARRQTQQLLVAGP